MGIAEKLKAVLRKKPGNRTNYNFEISRQNSPPDEREVDAVEDAAKPQISGSEGKSEDPRSIKSRSKKAGSNS